MKGKLRFLIFFVLVISSLIVLPSFNIKSTQADNSDSVESCYLINGNDAYESDVVAGTTFGYGDYLLGTNNVSLTTHANAGFKVAGWKIIYAEENSKVEQEFDFYTAEDLLTEDDIKYSKTEHITLTYLDDSNVEQTITIDYNFDYFDNDSDGYFEESVFTISKKFEDIKVEPVFDFIYYDVKFEDVNLIKLPTNSTELGTKTLYYTTYSVDNGITTYNNAFIKNENDLRYYENLYFNGTNYYTLHNTLEQTPTSQTIDISRGAYRLNQQIQLGVDIDITEDLYTSKNIHVNGVAVNDRNLILDAESESFSIEKDPKYERTTSVNCNFAINDSAERIENIKLNYQNFYIAKINLYVDDTLVDVENSLRQTILNKTTTLTNSYPKADNDESLYLFKTDSPSFKMVTTNFVQEIDGDPYSYYIFNQSESGFANNEFIKVSASENLEIDLYFTSQIYNIKFEFRELFQGSLREVEGDLQLPQTLQKIRGEGENLTSLVAMENTGYSFNGFILEDDELDFNNGVEGINILSNLDVEIDETKPTDKTVLIVYQAKEYQLVISNLNQIELTDNSNTYYPFNKLEIVRTRALSVQAEEFNSEIAGSITSANTFSINDIISVKEILNKGFCLNGQKSYEISFGENSRTTNLEELTFTIDKEFIEDFIDDNTKIINIEVFEDYVRYSINYYILSAEDGNFTDPIQMAEIDVEDLPIDITSDDVQISNNVLINNIEFGGKTITVSNLKLYDTFSCVAEGITQTFEEENYTYIFERFTFDRKVNLDKTVDGAKYKYQFKVSENSNNQSLEVIFSMPTTKLTISVNNANAFALFDDLNQPNVQVFSVDTNGTETPQTLDENGVVTLAPGTTKIVFNDASNIGYKFINATYNQGESSENISVNSANAGYGYANFMYFTFNVANDKINNIILNFNAIKYKLQIAQNGAEFENQFVMFKDELNNDVDYKFIDVEQANDITFEMPVGYFVSQTNNNYELSGMVQNPDITVYNYYYSIEVDELKYLISNNSTLQGSDIIIGLEFTYDVCKYSLQINYVLTNPRDDGKDSNLNYPELNVSINGQPFAIEKDGTIVRVNDVPYNSNVSILANETFGFSKLWKKEDGGIISYNDDVILNSVNSNRALSLNLNYKSYYVNLVYLNSQGQPKLIINDNEMTNGASISLFDSVKVVANPIGASGFKFKGFYKYYPANSYEEDLYVLNEETRILSKANSYETGKMYFKSTNINDSELTFTTQFKNGDFVLKGDKIYIYVEYAEREFGYEITNFADGFSLENIGAEGHKVNLTASDFATAYVYVAHKDENGEYGDYLLANQRFGPTDKLKIIIAMNTYSLDGQDYDLSLGLKLKNLKLGLIKDNLTQQIDFAFNADGYQNERFTYSATITIPNYISRIPSSDLLKLYLYFKIDEKSLTTTTNVDDESFYKTGSSPNFSMLFDSYDYGFSAGTQDSNGSKQFLYKLNFLYKTRISYEFDNLNYKSNFRITETRFYDENDVLINPSNYSKYGITENLTVGGWDVRHVNNLKVKYIVQPIITFNTIQDENGVYIFTKPFNCNSFGEGLEQKLTIGSTNAFDIQTALSANLLNVSYWLDLNAVSDVSAVDAKTYFVKIDFNYTEDYTWLENLDIEAKVKFVITPIDLTIECENISALNLKKEFNNLSNFIVSNRNFDTDKLVEYLLLKGNGLNIRLRDEQTILYLQTGYNAKVTHTIQNQEREVVVANESAKYNITIYNLNLVNNPNFRLTQNQITIKNAITITRKEIKINSIQVYDKIFDNSVNAEIKDKDSISLSGVVSGTNAFLNLDELKLTFDNKEVGLNKNITGNFAEILIGEHSANYFVSVATIKASIYPYSVSAVIEGLGTITIENNTTDKNLVKLLPIDAKLNVEIIKSGTNGADEIYKYINKSISRREEFDYAIKLSLSVGDIESYLDNNLTLVVPKTERLKSLIWLTGSQSDKLLYNDRDEYVAVDLSQIGLRVDKIAIIKEKVYLKLWQIVTISLLVVSGLGTGIGLFIYFRKKKKEKNTIFDKI